MDERILSRAKAIADDVLFPRSLLTDAADLVPLDLLDLMATDALYGVAAPAETGGSRTSSAARSPRVEPGIRQGLARRGPGAA